MAEVWGLLLRRPPSQADLDTWVGRLWSGTSLTSLVAMVLRSSDYARRW